MKTTIAFILSLLSLAGMLSGQETRLNLVAGQEVYQMGPNIARYVVGPGEDLILVWKDYNFKDSRGEEVKPNSMQVARGVYVSMVDMAKLSEINITNLILEDGEGDKLSGPLENRGSLFIAIGFRDETGDFITYWQGEVVCDDSAN